MPVKSKGSVRYECPNGCTDEEKQGDLGQAIIGERRGDGVYWLWCNACGDEPVPTP